MFFCDINSLPVNTHFFSKMPRVFFLGGEVRGALGKPRYTTMENYRGGGNWQKKEDRVV